MREAVGIPAGILVYSFSTILLLLLFEIFFAEPREWSIFITAATTIIAFKLTCAAVINFSSDTGVKVVAFMIAAFWVVSLGFDVFGVVSKTIDILSASQGSAKSLGTFKELVEAVWNSKVCVGVSAILALWTLSK